MYCMLFLISTILSMFLNSNNYIAIFPFLIVWLFETGHAYRANFFTRAKYRSSFQTIYKLIFKQFSYCSQADSSIFYQFLLEQFQINVVSKSEQPQLKDHGHPANKEPEYFNEGFIFWFCKYIFLLNKEIIHQRRGS